MQNLTHPNELFRRPYFGPYGVLPPQVLHALEFDQVLLAHAQPQTKVFYFLLFVRYIPKLAKRSI